MNYNQIRLVEECLYVRKELYGKMQELAIIVDSLMPKLPGSVLKMVGRPVAKNPFDTSETEHWGILRATCQEAQELEAKANLWYILKEFRANLGQSDREFIVLRYDKELPPASVQDRLRICSTEYYNTRMRLLRQLWKSIEPLTETIDAAVL